MLFWFFLGKWELIVRLDLAVLFIFLFFAGCEQCDGVAGGLLKEQARSVEDTVRLKFKYPDTAWFAYPPLAANVDLTENGHTIVCGEVNAVNDFGSYSGFMPFLGSLSEVGGRWVFNLQELAETESARESIIIACTALGFYGGMDARINKMDKIMGK